MDAAKHIKTDATKAGKEAVDTATEAVKGTTDVLKKVFSGEH